MESFITVQGNATAEIEIKKSRFIAHISHVKNEQEALQTLQTIKSENHDARHNVYAFRLLNIQTSTTIERFSDDGEPQKTAGTPTLEALDHANLSNVICVVTRYFGGTLLGTGGLIRAYAGATNAAIAKAHVVTYTRCVDIEVRIPYAQYDTIMHEARTHNVAVLQTQFSDVVSAYLRIRENESDAFVTKLQNLLRSTDAVHIKGATFAPHP